MSQHSATFMVVILPQEERLGPRGRFTRTQFKERLINAFGVAEMAAARATHLAGHALHPRRSQFEISTSARSGCAPLAPIVQTVLISSNRKAAKVSRAP